MNSEIDTEILAGLLQRVQGSGAEFDACLQSIRAQRGRSGGKIQAVDRLLVGQIAARNENISSLVHDLREIGNAQAQLAELVDRLTAAPWFPAVFLRLVPTANGRLAEIFHGEQRRLVQLSADIDPDALVRGQIVYLSAKRNIVMDVASGETPETGEIATVARVLDDGRLALRDRDEEVFVHAAQRVHDANIGVGDQVRWNRDVKFAFEPVQDSASDELFVEQYLSAKPAQRLGGLGQKVQQAVSLFTQSIANPELATRYGITGGQTLLLHGPPGNGKTSIARIVGAALAAATGKRCRFASVKGAQLESPWVGTTQANVRTLFRELRRGDEPTVVFLDEVESIGRHRGGIGGQHSDKFLASWLAEIDGLERRGMIGIIASTNRKDLVDQALLERLSGMDLFIGRPGLEAAREIFAIHLPPALPYGPNGAAAEHTRNEIIDTAVNRLYSPNADNVVAELRLRDSSSRSVSAREMLSGRTIEQLCVQAKRSAFRRHAEGGRHGVRVADMEDAIADALERLATTLTPANAHTLLGDLPQDLDVVAVEPVHRKIVAHRHLLRTPGA